MLLTPFMALLQDAAPAAADNTGMVKIIAGVLALVLVGIIIMRRKSSSKKGDDEEF